MSHTLVIWIGALLSNIYARGKMLVLANQPTPVDPLMKTYVVATIKNSEGRCVDLAWASERDYTPVESYPCVAESPNQQVLSLSFFGFRILIKVKWWILRTPSSKNTHQIINGGTRSILSYASYAQNQNPSNQTVFYAQPVGFRNASTEWKLVQVTGNNTNTTFKCVPATCNSVS